MRARHDLLDEKECITKIPTTVLTIMLTVALVGCGPAAPMESQATEQNAVSEQTVGSVTQQMTDDAATHMGSELSAFEITAKQRELAKNNEAGYEVLDAGRGNPN